MMSIIEQAIQLEKKAEAAYREAAHATSDPSAAKVLELFAGEEAQHAETLRGMENTAGGTGFNLIQSAKNWINGVVEGGAAAMSSDVGLLSLLRRALTIERTTESFYRDHANKAKDVAAKELLMRLADAEKQHFLLIGSLIDYFDRPKEWVENAEFGQRDEY